MNYDELVEKFQNLEPLNRRFAAAAIGLGIGAVIVPIPGLIGFAATFGAAFVASRFFSNAAPDPASATGRDMPEYLKNCGSMLGGTVAGIFMFAAMFGVPEDQQNDPALIGPQGGLEQIEETQSAAVTTPATVLSYQPA